MKQDRLVPVVMRWRCRGLSFIYVMLILIPLIGFASFAVDIGRVRLARRSFRRQQMRPRGRGLAHCR